MEKMNFFSRNQTLIPVFTLLLGSLIGLWDDFIQIYGTGVLPPGVDTARITNQPTSTSGTPVNDSIGGRSATVIYAGAAPGAVAGLFQINAIVPHDVEPDAQVPCIVTVGPAQSQDGVTIAVR